CLRHAQGCRRTGCGSGHCTRRINCVKAGYCVRMITHDGVTRMDLDRLHRLAAERSLNRDEYKMMVLLVDDQSLVGQAVRMALSKHPHISFHYCSRAEEAVGIAELTKPTVILQDLVMPGVDGLALVPQYRSNPATRDIPIVVLSSTDDPVMKRAAFAAGVNDYLVKLP